MACHCYQLSACPHPHSRHALATSRGPRAYRARQFSLPAAGAAPALSSWPGGAQQNTITYMMLKIQYVVTVGRIMQSITVDIEGGRWTWTMQNNDFLSLDNISLETLTLLRWHS